MSPRPERKARKDHKVLGEFAGNSLYPPTTRHVLRNKPELVEAAAAEALSKNRNAAIRQSVVLRTVRGELTASMAANQCGVGRSTMNRKLRAVKSKISMKKTALRCGRGGGRAPKPAPAVPTVNGSNGNGAQGEAGNAVEQAEIGVAAAGANAAAGPQAAPDQQHAAVVDLKRQLAEKEKTIEHQQARILSLEETVAVLQEDLGKKATMITGLRNQLDVLQQGPSRVENSVRETIVDQPSQSSGSVEVQDYVQHANPREKYKFDNCSQLGEGTHGKVLRVTLERETAIKVIKLPANNDAQVKLYLQEVEVMFTMSSKYLMRCSECYWWKNRLYIVMPLMRFGSLATLLEKIAEHKKKLDFVEAVWKPIAYTIFQGLDDLNSDNRMHRDVRADNILLDDDGTTKLTDFGWSRTLNSDEMANTPAGTWQTLAPEVAGNMLLQKEGKELMNYGPSVDVRSAGIVLAQMAVGSMDADVNEEDVFKLCKCIRDGRYAKAWRKRVQKAPISPGFRELVLTCLEDDASKRPTPRWLLDNMHFLRNATNRKPLEKLLQQIRQLDKRQRRKRTE